MRSRRRCSCNSVLRLTLIFFGTMMLFWIVACSSQPTSETHPEQPPAVDHGSVEPQNPPTPEVKTCSPPSLRITPENGMNSVFLQKVTGETEKRYASGSCSEKPTLSRTESTAGLAGTDLGMPFEFKGKTYVLFGDTTKSKNNQQKYEQCEDSIAYIESTDTDGLVKLHFLTDSASPGSWLPLRMQGTPLNCFDVPLDGVEGSDGNTMYVWFTNDNELQPPARKVMYESILGKTNDPMKQFTKVYTLSRYNDCVGEHGPVQNCKREDGKFVVITAEVVGDQVYLWGGGMYRGSDVYLAGIPLKDIEDKSALRYFAGMDAQCQPQWSTQEAGAVAVIDTRSLGGETEKHAANGCAGEISVKHIDAVDSYVAMYNCGNRVVMNAANTPWGPWSEAQVVFTPQEGGYCSFMYAKGQACSCLDDACSENRCGQGKNGGSYAPFIVKSKSDGSGGAFVDYFMSTWNPYNVVQMRTHLEKR